MISNLKIGFTAGMLVACFPNSSEDKPSIPNIPIDPNSSVVVDDNGSVIPGVSLPYPTSSTVVSSTLSSSGVISSSSVVFVPICQRRTPTSLDFQFITGNLMVAGWQPGSHEMGNLTVGTLIVPSGDPCEDAQELAAKFVGDEYNLFLKDAWRGRSADSIKIDVITWDMGPDTGNSSTTQTSSSSTEIPGAVAGWLTEEIYDQVFPNRDSFFTWTSFVEAFADLQKITQQGDFKSFLLEGTLAQKKREAAAFFGNIVQETGSNRTNTGLTHIVELCAENGVPVARCATNYGASGSNYYYGRGPLQLSWNYNYQSFSEAIYNNGTTLLYDPDRVHEDPKIAWLAAMWFWNRVDASFFTPPPTLHDIMINNAYYQGIGGFGGTIKVINGGYECSSANHPQAVNRAKYFNGMQVILGIPEDTSNLNCI